MREASFFASIFTSRNRRTKKSVRSRTKNPAHLPGFTIVTYLCSARRKVFPTDDDEGDEEKKRGKNHRDKFLIKYIWDTH